MRHATMFLGVVLLVGLGCSEPAPPIDLEAERSALMAADEAWASAYAESDTPAGAFVANMTADAVLLPPDAPIARGTEAVREVIAGLESLPAFSVSWAPSSADVGGGGDLGYTVGTYEMSFESPEGDPVATRGKYMTVWKKQADGSWKVVADMFNADAPPGPPEGEGGG